ncbi:hypothetical protein MTBSS4_600006 [Magnetospirillum sp. SS-4]|nr:hypothetical protein MTBSS4_600006 [Magnetospirillum sp. SS-4]
MAHRVGRDFISRGHGSSAGEFGSVTDHTGGSHLSQVTRVRLRPFQRDRHDGFPVLAARPVVVPWISEGIHQDAPFTTNPAEREIAMTDMHPADTPQGFRSGSPLVPQRKSGNHTVR